MAKVSNLTKQFVPGMGPVDSRKPHIWQMPKRYEGWLLSNQIPCRYCGRKSRTLLHLRGLAISLWWRRKWIKGS
jgi:hypothetical protein